MFQGIRELRGSRGKTALIITTVLLITAMVTLLSSLSAGLSFQSASALEYKVGSNQQLVLNDAGGTVSLSTGSLSDAQAREVESRGGEVSLWPARKMQMVSHSSPCPITATSPAKSFT